MKKEFTASGATDVWKTTAGAAPAFYFRANSDVNTDGSGRSYHPDDIAANQGLAQNIICNGVNRKSGSNTISCSSGGDSCQRCLDHFRSKPKTVMLQNFTDYFKSFAIATKGKAACVVAAGKPNQVFFVSTTSYIQSGKPDVCDPERYLDAMVYPSIAVPKSLLDRGVAMGDYVLVRNRDNDKAVFGVVYDSSGSRIGESSIAMNRLLLCDTTKPGCPPPPMPTKLSESYGLVVEDADYLVFSDTAAGWPSSPEAISVAAQQVFATWGGEDRLKACADAYVKP